MPVVITVRGSDDNVLAQVAADAAHAVTHPGSVRNRIEQVAADAGVGPAPAVSDANAIEWLAALIGQYVVAFDDDGTKLSQLSLSLFDGIAAPDYLSGTLSIEGGGPVTLKVGAISSEARGPVAVGGESVYGFQVNIADFPAGTIATGQLKVGGGFVLSDAAGTVIGVPACAATLDAGRSINLFNGLDGFRFWDGKGAQELGAAVALGVYVDTAAGRVGVSLGGADLGYFDPATAVGQVAKIDPFIYAYFQSNDVLVATIGVEALPLPASITVAMPAGCKAVNGQVI